MNRVEFRSTVPAEGHLSIYNEIDLSLDTLPWSGHTTACEALMMGVPTITLRGDRPAGRMVESVLNMAGLPGFVAANGQQFIDIAGSYAESPDELAALRSGLRAQVLASRLCNGAGYTAEIELHFRTIWHEWCTAD
jgi:predicted O-linked N-acetylglucosamine transferase (SPINDLY family)